MRTFPASCCKEMWSRISFPDARAPLACLVLAASCGGDEKAAADSAATPSVNEARAATADTSCIKAGAWQPCSVLDRLEHAGLVVTLRPEPARFPMFSIEGRTYETTRSTIHVFLYPDAAARRADTDRLDSVAVAPRGSTYTWPDPVTLVTSNNLAAVVLTPNERQAERIVLALAAGLPAARP